MSKKLPVRRRGDKAMPTFDETAEYVRIKLGRSITRQGVQVVEQRALEKIRACLMAQVYERRST